MAMTIRAPCPYKWTPASVPPVSGDHTHHSYLRSKPEEMEEEECTRIHKYLLPNGNSVRFLSTIIQMLEDVVDELDEDADKDPDNEEIDLVLMRRKVN